MRTTTGDSDLKKLFIYNRSVPTAALYADIERIERPWIDGLLRQVEATTPPIASRAEWVERLDEMLAEEAAGSESTRFLAEDATREQFRSFVREFGLDGLTEAQNFFPAVMRVPIKSQMALMRVLIDEFGCGNLQQSHSHLYGKLLAELDLPGAVEDLVDTTSDETFQMLNAFYWLASRAPTVEYFLGALAYLEASIPSAFSCLAQACSRLGLENGAYYTEHLHIDAFHMKELQTAIREFEVVNGLDPTKVLIGAKLLSTLIAGAVDAAVARARRQVDVAVG
ncbi:MAG: iron-containing redox enzyme family protein [Saccharothrix sp.]|nr:iron-containing redox enzyme family protein [Saccharothrix sp.]